MCDLLSSSTPVVLQSFTRSFCLPLGVLEALNSSLGESYDQVSFWKLPGHWHIEKKIPPHVKVRPAQVAFVALAMQRRYTIELLTFSADA